MKVKVRIRSLEGGQQRLGWSLLLWILELRDESHDSFLELVSKELNNFGVIVGLFRQIGGQSSRFLLFCSF